jgi:dihydroorotate dehydrogenase electron transfer subunit
MKTERLFTLERTRQLTEDVYEMLLSGDMSDITAPGQFVDLELPGRFLRRPISICNWTKDALLLLVRVAGDGTREMVRSVPGTEFKTLSGLGNGFDVKACAGKKPILMGGGIGIAPLYGLAQRLLEEGITPTIALGFRNEKDSFYLNEFLGLGCPTFIATEDGSLGTKGFVTDLVAPSGCDFCYVCGPTPMLKAVYGVPQLADGEFSFEARMACGFGACVGCTIQTANGPKRVCKDGPVFRKEEIVW